MGKLDIVAEKLDGAKRYRNYVAALCIFHEDSKPSMFVYEDGYRCAACGAHGSTDSLIRKLGSIPERRMKYANTKADSRNPFTRWLSNRDLQQTISISQGTLCRRSSHYLQTRYIPESYQRSLKLGLLDGFITFPIYNHWNELTGAIARVGENNTASAKYYLPAEQDPKLLYVPSWEMIKESTEVFVTFGIIDAITLHIMGYASASTTTGQSINPSAFDRIRKRIIFVPDKFEEKAAHKIAAKLSWRGSVLRLPYPLGTKDINDWYTKDKDKLKDEIYGIKEQNI